ncbi:MAG TPA: hypothetical protein VN372_15520 [Methanospirillum sp.]|nr:hypothetical protein [Methanospirillum sp.]
MTSLLPALILALFLTIISEWAIFSLIYRHSPAMLLVYAILINSFTNPLMNGIYLITDQSLLYLETLVILVETLLIWLLIRGTWRSALFCSLCANVISVIAGRILL